MNHQSIIPSLTAAEFEDIIGHKMFNIRGLKKGSRKVIFIADNGDLWKMYHEQECCETVEIQDVCGDVNDLIGLPIVEAYCTSNKGETGPYGDTSTWTFYRIRTIKGTVTIHWHGESNGYYSEEVDFVKVATGGVEGNNQ